MRISSSALLVTLLPLLVPTASVQTGTSIPTCTPEKGWMVNTRGEIWHTPDSGFSWLLQKKETAANFRSTTFRDERVGWAGTVFTPGKVLWETRDGGDTWIDISHRIEGHLPGGICGMVAVSDDVAYGVGAFHGLPSVIKTNNGGITWVGTSVAQVAATLIDVHFFDELTGVATGGTGSNLDGDAVVIRTEDGGQNWERVYRSTRGPSVSGEWGWKMSFPTPDVGYISVETSDNPARLDAKVLKTTDSGHLDGAINRFYSVNDTLMYAIGLRTYRISGFGTIGTDIRTTTALPDRFTLGASYPNPFTENVTLPYSLDDAAPVRITVIDVLGRILHVSPEEMKSAGTYTFTWDGRDLTGRKVSSGTYLLLVDIGRSPEMKQVVFVR